MTQDALNAAISIKLNTDDKSTRASGVLLNGGTHVLTVAHLFNDNPISAQALNLTSLEGYTASAKNIYIYHNWQATDPDYNHDIAIIELTSPLTQIAGLALWKNNEIIEQTFLLAGFGGDNYGLHSGSNIFEADGSLFNQPFNKNIIPGTQLLYDYDNGIEAQNILNGFFGVDSTTIPTQFETLAKQGDSGGPLIIDDQIAAISSYSFRSAAYDVNDLTDFSAGEMGIATNLTPYIPWIESIVLGNPTSPKPVNASDVVTSVAEPFSGTVINYFLLEMNQPQTVNIVLQFKTQDGTATAGEDYVSSNGTIELLPGEQSLAIPIVIIGDTKKEEDETFSLLISDSSGLWIKPDIELIATHTIINNDII